MATGLYKSKGGIKTELTAKEVKRAIQSIRGWNDDEYNRQRKQLTKRINTYNALMQADGGKLETRTSVQILYAQSKAMNRYGQAYQPSQQTQLLLNLSATSGKSRGTKAIEKARLAYSRYVDIRFAGLIQSNAKAREIYERIQDPVKLDKALAKFANDMHVSLKESKDAVKNQAIPFSTQTYGSDDYDIDITAYLS